MRGEDRGGEKGGTFKVGRTWKQGSLIPRPSLGPVLDVLQAIKNWSQGRPGIEARNNAGKMIVSHENLM